MTFRATQKKPSTTRRHTTLVALALAVGVCLVGCDKKKAANNTTTPPEDDDKTLADDGADTNVAENDPELITSSLISSSPTGSLGLASTDVASSGDIGTRTFGDGARGAYLPRGCLTVTNDEATSTATYKFARCVTGPNGLLRGVNGEVVARYRVAENQLHLDLTGNDLTVNRATVDWHATADITTEGSKRTMHWSAQLSGTTAGGRAFTRTTTQTVAWTIGDVCFELSGTSEGKIRDRDIKTEVTNFRRCKGSCPDDGGKISVTNVTKAKTIELLYNGTGTATFVDSTGKRSPVLLPCSLL